MALEQVKELPKSMLAAKSFETTTGADGLERWMRILAEELADRLAEDAAAHARRPRLLTLYYRRACPWRTPRAPLGGAPRLRACMHAFQAAACVVRRAGAVRRTLARSPHL